MALTPEQKDLKDRHFKQKYRWLFEDKPWYIKTLHFLRDSFKEGLISLYLWPLSTRSIGRELEVRNDKDHKKNHLLRQQADKEINDYINSIGGLNKLDGTTKISPALVPLGWWGAAESPDTEDFKLELQG